MAFPGGRLAPRCYQGGLAPGLGCGRAGGTCRGLLGPISPESPHSAALHDNACPARAL